MRFVFLNSWITLHASFPPQVALAQLHFAWFAVTSSPEDFHLQDTAHDGRTKKRLALAAGALEADRRTVVRLIRAHRALALARVISKPQVP